MKFEFDNAARSFTNQRIRSGREQSAFILHPLPPSSLRILLWDIDGTLIRSVRPDSFKDYTIPMLEEVFGTAGRLREMQRIRND
mgnify:CR=1 FL=1